MDIEELDSIQDIDWARLAMCIDCEGSIMITKQRDPRHFAGYRYLNRIQVSNTNYRLVDWLQFFFGFNINKRKTKQKQYHKDQYIAYVDSHLAVMIAHKIYPWLVIKRELAQLIIEMQESLTYQSKGRGVRVPNEVMLHRDNLYLRAKELNTKGVSLRTSG